MSLAAADLSRRKNSRLTGLGHDVEAEFRRMVVAMKSVRNHSEHWAMGAPRAGCRRRAHRRTKGIYGILRERIGGDAIHRNQAALAPVERGHIGGAFRKIPRVHHAA